MVDSTPETTEDASTMTGSKSFAERMEGMEGQELQDVGLKGLGAQLSNTQILEQEMMGKEDSKDSGLDDEEFEIDMGDDENGVPLDGRQSPSKGKSAEAGAVKENETTDKFEKEVPKRTSSSKFSEGSQSPKKAKYPDLSQSMSSQGSKQGPRTFIPGYSEDRDISLTNPC